ncbi:probable serine/threonine-protein kinase dyrk2 isoform X1 [Tanacetum coccineum]
MERVKDGVIPPIIVDPNSIASNFEVVMDGTEPSAIGASGNIQSLEDTIVLGSFPPLPTQATTPAGNAPSKSSYANVTGKPSGKKLNIRTLFTPGGNGIDVVVPVESIRAISDRFANAAYGFFLGKRVAYPVVANYVRNTWGKYGLVRSMFSSSTRLFSFQFSSMEGLDTMLENGPWFIRNNPLILKKWHPDENLLKEDVSTGEKKAAKNPSQTSRGVPVGPKLGFKPQKEYRPVSKMPIASSSGNKKKGVEPTIAVSNSNPFEVLNSVDNDVEFCTNANLFEELLTSEQAIHVDDVGNPLKKVEFLDDYDSENEVASVDNDIARSLASERVGFGTQSLMKQLTMHHFVPFNQSSINVLEQDYKNILKGVEAPRNSLELEEQQQQDDVKEVASSSSSSLSSSKLKHETSFNIPNNGIQIKTKRSRLMDNDVSSECSSSSPSTKTPSLVARLMGLDLLPENSSLRTSLSSPRPSSSSSYATPLNPLSKLSSHKNNVRSLPTTPRASTGARSSTTEVDYHHRFSLQVNNKENKRRYDHESKSEYAKQYVQQLKENISRRVGADITNTTTKREQRRDECLVVLKPKRPSTLSSTATIDKSRNLDKGHGRGKENEPVQFSSSPRHRLLEIKNNFTKPISNSPKCSSPLSSSTTKSPPLMKQETQVLKQEAQVLKPMKVPKCNKIANEKYDLRLKKMNQQEEHFMKKCNNNKKKSTPLSNHLVNVNVNTTTKFISFKKDMASSSSTTLPQKHVTQESNANVNGIVVAATTTNSGSLFDHFEYISRILSRTGISKNTLISITHWYSPSHPLQPSMFDDVEQQFHLTADVANRKLVFDVTNELLVEILKPYISFKPWAISSQHDTRKMNGSELTRKLSDKIASFPSKDCRVLEDIDGLIEGDMSRMTRVIAMTAFEEEAEEIVAELERDVVDTLVGEMAGIIWHVG